MANRFPPFGRLQATTIALRLGRALGLGGGSEQQAWRPPRPVADVAGRRRAALPSAEQQRYDALLARMGGAGVPDPAAAGAVIQRAFAGGSSFEALDHLALAWPELTDSERSQVAAPLRSRQGTRDVLLADAPARQTDQTTCGSTVLAMLAAAGDPLLALWLVTGRGATGRLPVEVAALDASAQAAPTALARFAAVQLGTKTRSNRRALGPFSWPARMGTPPWGAARVARHPGVSFRGVMIDDTDTDGFAALLDRADHALAAGVPVPLFTGGDLSTGLMTAAPRHVVLLTPREAVVGEGAVGEGATDAITYVLFDPASGALYDVTRAEMLESTGPRPAFGGWSHVCWAILPES